MIHLIVSTYTYKNYRSSDENFSYLKETKIVLLYFSRELTEHLRHQTDFRNKPPFPLPIKAA